MAGAGSVLEVEPQELQAFARHQNPEARQGEALIYGTAPSGAGYLEELARRLPEVAVNRSTNLETMRI